MFSLVLLLIEHFATLSSLGLYGIRALQMLLNKLVYRQEKIPCIFLELKNTNGRFFNPNIVLRKVTYYCCHRSSISNLLRKFC